jgi:hypothetical protein
MMDLLVDAGVRANCGGDIEGDPWQPRMEQTWLA